MSEKQMTIQSELDMVRRAISMANLTPEEMEIEYAQHMMIVMQIKRSAPFAVIGIQAAWAAGVSDEVSESIRSSSAKLAMAFKTIHNEGN